MKALLIYNDNIASQIVFEFERELGESYKFQVGKQELLNSNFSIDGKIDRILKTEFKNDKYDSIFIPYSLSEDNYIEFTGLRFACHIRLTPEFKNIQTPIVFFGYETENEINKLSKLGSILFSRGVYRTEKISAQDFKRQLEYIENNYNETKEKLFVKQFTERVIVKPSGNYATHHSITNEWSIYRWAKTVNTEDDAIEGLTQKINSNLYFKYLQTIYPIHESQILKENDLKIKYSGNPKILYIDDEAEKGWYEVFCKILYDVNKIDFDYTGDNFKNQTEDEIIESSFAKVKDDDADIVILDFRLHQNDFEKNDINEVTGIKILEKIKEYNPGIQVIIFSATNKVWNLQALQDAGTDGFIMKESPENSVDESFTKDSIKLFKETIEKSSKRTFLKELWIKIDKLRILASDYKNDIDIAWRLLYSSNSSTKYINYAYLQLFLIIEKFITEDTVFIKNTNGANYVIGLNGEEILVFNYLGEENRQPNYKSAIVFENGKYGIKKDSKYNRRLDTNAIVSALLIFRFGQKNSSALNWTQVYKIRNGKAAHPEDGIVTTEELLRLINFIMFIVNKANISKANNDSGLEKPTLEESVNLLREKFQN